VRGWWRHRSLRARLTAAATVVIAAVVAIGAALLLWRVNAAVVAKLDGTITREALSVGAVVRNAGQPQVPRKLSGDTVVQVVDRSGHVVASSANIDGESRLFTFKAPTALANVRIHTVSNVPVGEQAEFRVAVTEVGGSVPYTVYVGRPLDQTIQSTTELAIGLAVGVPALATVLGGITWLLVGLALRPVEVLRQQAAKITVTDLHLRVGVPPTRDELARLAATLNELLSGLDKSLSQQRQFIADAAHELRSPITSLMAQLEVAQIEETQIEETQRRGGGVTPAELAPEVWRLSRLVDDLLTLASLDAAPSAPDVPVDLDDLVFAELQRPRRRTDVTVDVSGVSAASIRGDTSMLTRMVRNLLDNAVRHARSRVEVTLSTEGIEATLVVGDDGPGIPEHKRDEVFERFTRLDDARDRDAGGRGLGLAIVRDVVRAHHGSIGITDNRPGARFIVRLPAAEPA
jgi:signal transduction histidine kinase